MTDLRNMGGTSGDDPDSLQAQDSKTCEGAAAIICHSDSKRQGILTKCEVRLDRKRSAKDIIRKALSFYIANSFCYWKTACTCPCKHDDIGTGAALEIPLAKIFSWTSLISDKAKHSRRRSEQLNALGNCCAFQIDAHYP